jgi:hypothetical protein
MRKRLWAMQKVIKRHAQEKHDEKEKELDT